MRIRAIAAIGLAAAALLTASACRVEQGAALFVGSERITQQRVEEIVGSVPDDTREDLAQRMGISTGGLRGYVVQSLATVELGKRIAADTGADPDKAAGEAAELGWEESNVDGDSEFVKLASDASKYRPLLFEGAKPDAPTKSEIDENTDTLAQILTNKMQREQLRAKVDALLNSEAGQAAVGRQRQVDEYIAEYDLTANPRYGLSYILVAPSGQQQPPIIAAIPS